MADVTNLLDNYYRLHFICDEQGTHEMEMAHTPSTTPSDIADMGNAIAPFFSAALNYGTNWRVVRIEWYHDATEDVWLAE